MRVTSPDFIGIGAMRSGTTWLNHQLKNHPQVFVPPFVKEIHYFDRHFDRGFEWYQGFFKQKATDNTDRIYGEITPKYLYDKDAPKKAASLVPDAKLVAILRNPADRAYSHFRSTWRSNVNFKLDFETYIANEPEVFNRGLYGEQLTNWLHHYQREKILVLIYEEVMSNPEQAFEEISNFLGIDKSGFTVESVSKKINAGHSPKFPKLYQIGVFLRKKLRFYNLHFLATAVISAGKLTRKIFGENVRQSPSFSSEFRRELMQGYKEDVLLLEVLLGREITVWKS